VRRDGEASEPPQGDSVFPAWVGPGIPRRPSRLAWCYGDLGVAVVLLAAARCAGRPEWESEALRIARQAARWSPERNGVVDACLCHGAAGAAHLFNRLWQASGDPELAATARYWVEQALQLRRSDRGIAGFAALFDVKDGQEQWLDDPGLLLGPAGIGLALLASATPTEPAWDRSLLVSIRAANRRDAIDPAPPPAPVAGDHGVQG
jgi:hypothetical protein